MLQYEFSVLKNVMIPGLKLGRYQSEELEYRAMEKLKLFGIERHAHKKPNQLSGGEKQRVAIARALINDPLIIMGDEPTGNLDTKTSYDIMNLFQELHDKGNTIIMVTHEDDIAHYAHRIIRLRDGLIEWDRVNDKVNRATAHAAPASH